MSSDSESEIVSDLAQQYLRERRAGRRPSLSRLIEQHPQLAEQIRDAVSMMELMEDIARDSSANPEKHLERLGEYRIHRVIGEGGMGTVYEATQESLGRRVALKVCPLQGSERQRERFRRESRSAAMLHYTNIVPVFAVGEADGHLFYAMQYIRGATLADVITELEQIWQSSPVAKTRLSEVGITSVGSTIASQVAVAISHTGSAETVPPEPAVSPTESTRLSLPGQSESSNQPKAKYWESVARIGVQVAEALAYAHGKDTLHRDIKPGNLMLDQSGVVWLMDFGLAKSIEEEDLTRDGELIGTLRYMAPEQVAGKPTASSDVYSLGLTLYELLTLRPAFDELSRSALLRAVGNREPIAPRRFNAHIPRDLETIVLKSMEREQSRRYASARALADDLGRYLAGEPIEARRVTPVERLRKWVNRRPLVAGLTIALVSLFCIAFSLVTWQWRAAVIARGQAEAALDDALQSRYRSGISRVEAIARTSPRSAVSILQSLSPRDGETDRRGWEWGYLNELAQQSELILPDCGAKDAEWIRSLAFSADETLLAVGACRTGYMAPRGISPQGRVTLWDLRTGRKVQEFAVNDSGYSLAISGDQKRIAICDARAAGFNEATWSGPLWLWDIESGKRSLQLETPDFRIVPNESAPRSIVRVRDLKFFDNDSRIIGTVWSNNSVPGGTAIWNTADGTLEWFRPRSELIRLETDARRILIAESPYKEAFQNVWVDLESKQTLETLDAVLGTSLHPHEEFSLGMKLPNARHRPYLDDFRTGQKRLLWGDDNYKAVGGQFERPIHSVHPNKKRVAIGGSDGTVRIWQTQTGELQRILYGHAIDVQSLCYSPSGRWLASGDWNGEVRLWRPDRFAEYVTCEPLGQAPASCYLEDISFRFGGSSLVSSGNVFDLGYYGDINRRSHLSVFEPNSGRRLRDDHLPPMRTKDRHRTVKFDLDGQAIASIGRDNVLRVHRVVDREEVFRSHVPDRDLKDVAIGGTLVATSRGPQQDGDENEQVVVQDVETTKTIQTFSMRHAGALTLSPEGHGLAVACSSENSRWTQRVRYFDLEAKRQIDLPPPSSSDQSQSNISAVEFSTDGQRLAVAWENGLLGIYDLHDLEHVPAPVIRLADVGISDLAWHPSGQRLAGANRESVTLWNSAGETLLTLRGRPRSADLPFDAAVAFSQDGTKLAATQWDNTIRVWNSTSPRTDGLDREKMMLPVPSHPNVARVPLEAHSIRAMNKVLDAVPDDPWFLAARGQLGSSLRDLDKTSLDYERAKRLLAGDDRCLFLHGDAYIEAPSLPLHELNGHTIEAWVKHWNYQQPGQVYGVIACQYPRLPEDFFALQAFTQQGRYDRFGFYWLRPTDVYDDVRETWVHLAVCFNADGRTYFLNGKKVSDATGTLSFPREMSSFLIGATPLGDPQMNGEGLIRSLRFSEGVRYQDGVDFVPDERISPDKSTLLQFDFEVDDGVEGVSPKLVRDRSGNGYDGTLKNAWWLHGRPHD